MVKGQTQYIGSCIPIEIPDIVVQQVVTDYFDWTANKSLFSEVSTIDKSADRDFCVKVIEYLNQCAGTSFSTKYPSSHTDLILQRKKEHKVGLQDFFRVIDNKVNQWKGDPKTQVWLRPGTLFRKTKFANYLGERTSNRQASTSSFDKFTNTAIGVRKSLIEGGSKVE